MSCDNHLDYHTVWEAMNSLDEEIRNFQQAIEMSNDLLTEAKEHGNESIIKTAELLQRYVDWQWHRLESVGVTAWNETVVKLKESEEPLVINTGMSTESAVYDVDPSQFITNDDYTLSVPDDMTISINTEQYLPDEGTVAAIPGVDISNMGYSGLTPELFSDEPQNIPLNTDDIITTGIHTDYLNDAAYGLGEDTQQADELWDAVGFNPDEEPKP